MPGHVLSENPRVPRVQRKFADLHVNSSRRLLAVVFSTSEADRRQRHTNIHLPIKRVLWVIAFAQAVTGSTDKPVPLFLQ